MYQTRTAPPSSRRRTRHLTLRLVGVWLAMLAAVVGFGTANATAGDAKPRRPSLEGIWDLTVTVRTPDGGTSSTTPRFVFRPDHKLTAEGPPDGNGNPQYRATGFWNERNDGTFSFYVTHPGREDGAYLGTVQAVHLGRVTGGTFTTAAHAFVTTTAAGDTQGPITVSSSATRVSATTR